MKAQGHIYIITCKGSKRIKIGYSAEPDKRLAQLQTGSPYELSLFATWPGTVENERQAHEALASYRCGGEWFEIEPDQAHRLIEERIPRPPEDYPPEVIDQIVFADLDQIEAAAKTHSNWRARARMLKAVRRLRTIAQGSAPSSTEIETVAQDAA